MTPLTKAQIPASIDTVEKLNVWTAMILNNLYLTQTAIEGDGLPQRVAQFAPYFVANDNTTRILSRMSFQVENNYGSSGQKMWVMVDSLGADAIPDEFLS